MVLDRLQEMDSAMDNQTSLLNNHQHLLDLLNNQTTRLQELDSHRQIHINWLAHLSPSTSFRGHQYFLSPKGSIHNVFQAIQLCQGLGGHIAEVDDQSEWNFLVDFIGKQKDCSDRIYLGSYMDDAGKWRHIRSGEIDSAMDLLLKDKTYMDGINDERCQTVLNGNEYDDFDCVSSNQQCLCENPRL